MIPAPLILTAIMGSPRLKTRRIQGLVGASIVSITTLACFGGLLGWVIHNDVDRTKTPPAVDWTDSAFAGGFILYLLSGVVYACFQIIAQWTLGSLSNDPSVCARYAGAFKGTVSFGMCISFTIDSQMVSYRDQTIIQLCIYALGIVSLLYVIWFHVKDTNYFLEEAVIVPLSAEERAVMSGKVPQEVIEHEHIKERIAEEITEGVKVDSV